MNITRPPTTPVIVCRYLVSLLSHQHVVSSNLSLPNVDGTEYLSDDVSNDDLIALITPYPFMKGSPRSPVPPTPCRPRSGCESPGGGSCEVADGCDSAALRSVTPAVCSLL